ncbi:MAG: hypothetical protein QFB86_04645 [Patescibacteria group bacterium]|nr:hypothetical protein [Patescibacteria group bacterium]
MANDMQWPSEEEDFDAVTVNNNISRQPQATARATDDVTPPPRSVPVSVTDNEATEEVPTDSEAANSETVDSTEESQPEAPQEELPSLAEEQAPQTEDVSEPKQPAEPEAVKEPASAEGTAPEAVSEPVTSAAVPLSAASSAVASAKTPEHTGHAGVLRTILELLLVAGLIGLGIYAYGLHKDKQDLQSQVTTLNANPQLAVQRQTDQLIKNVSQLMSLPQGETPTVANVSDAAKAKQQSNFFAKAENGDRVLMYVKAGEAILYRPSTNKIILVAPLTFNNSTAATSSSATTATPTTAPAATKPR